MIAKKISVPKRTEVAMTSPTRFSIKKDEAKVIVTPSPKSSSKITAISPVLRLNLAAEGKKLTSKPAMHVKAQSLSSQTQTPNRNVKKKETKKGNERASSVDPKDLKSPESPHSMKSSLIISPRTEKVYRLVRKSTGALGGNGYDGAIYGEVTMHSMQRVINTMIEQCELNFHSRFIDIGAGLGKPNFHVAQDPMVRLSIGVELEDIRWKLSIHNLSAVVEESDDPTVAPLQPPVEGDEKNVKLYGGNINFIVNDIDNATSTDPFTHIYQFDLGFPPPLHQSIARKFNESKYARYLVSYRPPHRVMGEYGYAVEPVTQILTSMFGSGEGHTAYFYKRINIPTQFNSARMPKVKLPARKGFAETDEDVHCDPAFLPAVTDAVSKVSTFRVKTNELLASHLSSARPTRTRVPRVLS